MSNFKHLKIDPKAINSAETFGQLVEEDEAIEKQMKEEQRKRDALQVEQLITAHQQNILIKELENKLLEEQKERRIHEKAARRVNLITASYYRFNLISICNSNINHFAFSELIFAIVLR